MNIKKIGTLLLATGTLGLVAGCVMEPDGRVHFQPVVVEAPPPITVEAAPAPPPPPVVATVDVVPDDYVWDGDEYVGVVGDQYFYLGPGNVWIVCDPVRLGRFHGWEHYHSDWRVHAIHNDRFRNDAHGHYHAPHRDDHHH